MDDPVKPNSAADIAEAILDYHLGKRCDRCHHRNPLMWPEDKPKWCEACIELLSESDNFKKE